MGARLGVERRGGVEELQVKLVDDGGRGEGVVAAFAMVHVGGGDAAEFVVDGGEEAVTGGTVAVTPVGEPLGYRLSVFWHGKTFLVYRGLS